MKSMFAIRKEDALLWQDATNEIASIAVRAGFDVRPKPGWPRQWQVWATEKDFADLCGQATAHD